MASFSFMIHLIWKNVSGVSTTSGTKCVDDHRAAVPYAGDLQSGLPWSTHSNTQNTGKLDPLAIRVDYLICYKREGVQILMRWLSPSFHF